MEWPLIQVKLALEEQVEAAEKIVPTLKKTMPQDGEYIVKSLKNTIDTIDEAIIALEEVDNG